MNDCKKKKKIIASNVTICTLFSYTKKKVVSISQLSTAEDAIVWTLRIWIYWIFCGREKSVRWQFSITCSNSYFMWGSILNVCSFHLWPEWNWRRGSVCACVSVNHHRNIIIHLSSSSHTTTRHRLSEWLAKCKCIAHFSMCPICDIQRLKNRLLRNEYFLRCV